MKVYKILVKVEKGEFPTTAVQLSDATIIDGGFEEDGSFIEVYAQTIFNADTPKDIISEAIAKRLMLAIWRKVEENEKREKES